MYNPTMPRIRIHPGQSLGLPLTAAERALIADGLVLDNEYIERVMNAPPDKLEVSRDSFQRLQELSQSGDNEWFDLSFEDTDDPFENPSPPGHPRTPTRIKFPMSIRRTRRG
jgi:hypothetical protein